MVELINVGESAVGRIWSNHDFKPHRITGFKLSNDKNFQEELEDVVGLYLLPPENSMVLAAMSRARCKRLTALSLDYPLTLGAMLQ